MLKIINKRNVGIHPLNCRKNYLIYNRYNLTFRHNQGRLFNDPEIERKMRLIVDHRNLAAHGIYTDDHFRLFNTEIIKSEFFNKIFHQIAQVNNR